MFTTQLVMLISLASVTFMLAGCAGPATPLGAPWATDSSQVRNGPLSFISSMFEKSKATIQFDPPHQVLHGPSQVKVTIKDPAGIKTNYKLVVRYNALDVTPNFLMQAKTEQSADKTQVTLRLPVIRLSAKTDHLIEIIYGGNNAYARYEPPSCHAFEKNIIRKTGEFHPDSELLATIDRISKQNGFNPAFTAALIAQESGFNPKTVSWARAIGLTQVTAIAEDEVSGQLAEIFPSWPRYPGLNHIPLLWVKAMVTTGQINPTNEWRLDNERSIQGGLAFAQLLAERWATTENMAKIRATFEDAEAARTRLVLASYNSGYSRVQAALYRLGPAWLTAPELREARKYVNRIQSYCDHFSNDDIEVSNHEVLHEDKT